MEIKFILELTKFVVFSILFYLLPGFAISKNFYISLPLGLTTFTLLVYINGLFFNFEVLNYLFWLIPIISLTVIFIKKYYLFKIPKTSLSNLPFLLLILIGSSFWLLTTFRSGMPFDYGYGYWGPNGHDGIWHISLIAQLNKNLPPDNPIFTGEKLTNYHYFFDLLVAKTATLFNFNTQDLLFRFFPLMFSLLSGLLMYKVVNKIFNNYKASLFAVFFLYFGGSFGWVVNFFRGNGFGGETMFWAQQSISTLLNPPFAISLVVFLAGLYLYYDLREKKNLKLSFWLQISLLWGTLIEFKAYIGVLVLAALILVSIEKIIKRDFRYLYILISTSALSLIVFLPNNLDASTLFVFYPFWFVETMTYFYDRFYWERLYFAMTSGNIIKTLTAYIVGTFIFFIGNFGTRVIGFLNLKALFQERLLFYIFLFGILIPMFFVQKGTNWNSIQFFYYSLLILNIFAGLIIAQLFKKRNKTLAVVFSFIVIFLTLPTTISTASQYIPNTPPAKLSNFEIKALEFLRNEPEGVVLNNDFNNEAKVGLKEPLPLYAYVSTAYVSAFSNKPSFLEDTVNLDILGIDYQKRLSQQKKVINNEPEANEILTGNDIDYLYLVKKLSKDFSEVNLPLSKIFENDEVKIFRVN